jgi:hypothetical protein
MEAHERHAAGAKRPEGTLFSDGTRACRQTIALCRAGPGVLAKTLSVRKFGCAAFHSHNRIRALGRG